MIVHLGHRSDGQSWALIVDADLSDDILNLAVNKFSNQCRDLAEILAPEDFYIIDAAEDILVLK